MLPGRACVLSRFRWIWLFVTLWNVAHQALLSMEFSRQEYWSGLLYPPPGDLPDPGIQPASPMSPSLAGRFFTTQETNLSKEWAWLPLRPSPCELRWPGNIEHQPQGHLLCLLVVSINHVRSLPGASSPFLLWESFFDVLLMSTRNLPCVSWDPLPLSYRYFHHISSCIPG